MRRPHDPAAGGHDARWTARLANGPRRFGGGSGRRRARRRPPDPGRVARSQAVAGRRRCSPAKTAARLLRIASRDARVKAAVALECAWRRKMAYELAGEPCGSYGSKHGAAALVQDAIRRKLAHNALRRKLCWRRAAATLLAAHERGVRVAGRSAWRAGLRRDSRRCRDERWPWSNFALPSPQL